VSDDAALDALLRELTPRASHSHRDDLVRLATRLRARDACEYCLIPTLGTFHVDHIIPAALWPSAGSTHGPEHLDNYAWSCANCNTAKGQQIARRVGRHTVRLFNPRRDQWPEHFAFFHHHLIIRGISPIGRATELALSLNDPRLGGPLAQRHDFIVLGQFPPPWAAR
jgi:5-methylcytosine-specific restriction endonuclease McrA